MPKSIRSAGLKALGRAIATARKEQGMTQRQFAASLGIDQGVMARIEIGMRRLDVVEFITLARAMNVEPSALLKVVEEATPASHRI